MMNCLVPVTETEDQLLTTFVACRTTLDDLARRTLVAGRDISVSELAALLTGRSTGSDAAYNAVADAINDRLGEMSLPPEARRR